VKEYFEKTYPDYQDYETFLGRINEMQKHFENDE
jgi:hypothetical protein